MRSGTLELEQASAAGSHAVETRGVCKRYGDALVLDDVTISVGQGQFLSLLGPSGCGKTTTLRVLAGFERPNSGDVRIDGASVLELPPWKRDIGIVFQTYALFPYLSAADNVAFGLKMRKVPRAERDRAVADALKMVGLEGFAARYPHQLSGGQRQRVALARALVFQPKLLLLDEPLSNLDARLRDEMRLELKRIQRESGVTTVFVTHDQQEAFSLSDRIVVMNKGRVVQAGTPREIWERPASAFVAGFVGDREPVSCRGERGWRRAIGLRHGAGVGWPWFCAGHARGRRGAGAGRAACPPGRGPARRTGQRCRVSGRQGRGAARCAGVFFARHRNCGSLGGTDGRGRVRDRRRPHHDAVG